MSAFLSDLRLRMVTSSDGVPLKSHIGKQLFELESPLIYESDVAGMTILVPAGFQTDLSSIPRLPIIHVSLSEISDLPAVIHDYLYETKLFARAMADLMLYEACRVIGLSRFEAHAIYFGARLGGARYYFNS